MYIYYKYIRHLLKEVHTQLFSIYFKKRSAPEQSITRWFLVCFTCVSIIFSIALIPLISYCRNVFTELEIKKSTQQMDFGISQLENTVTSIASASQSLTNATQFISFHYLEPDYSSISISVRNQLKNYRLVIALIVLRMMQLFAAADSVRIAISVLRLMRRSRRCRSW